MRRSSRSEARWLVVALAAVWASSAAAYESKIHQQLTFIAAKQFSRCAAQFPEIRHPSALETRYVVRANVAQADTNVFVRMFRWNYYNRADEANRSTLWMIDTRFHGHFDGLREDLDDTDRRRDRLRTFGRILNYLQDVTSPAHVVPVFTSRWWRFSFGDRFDRFRLDVPAIEAALTESCARLADLSPSFDALLTRAASGTIAAVRSKITGYPATWEAYWQFADDEDEFGEYGPAGNQFGARTSFACGNGERCLLLANDPLYRAFALERHVAAVETTMQAMLLMQALENARAEMEPLELNAD